MPPPPLAARGTAPKVAAPSKKVTVPLARAVGLIDDGNNSTDSVTLCPTTTGVDPYKTLVVGIDGACATTEPLMIQSRAKKPNCKSWLGQLRNARNALAIFNAAVLISFQPFFATMYSNPTTSTQLLLILSKHFCVNTLIDIYEIYCMLHANLYGQ